MIDFNTGEIQLLEKNILGFAFGDYYTSRSCKDTDDKDIGNIDLLIFYCLE